MLIEFSYQSLVKLYCHIQRETNNQSNNKEQKLIDVVKINRLQTEFIGLTLNEGT